MNSGQRSGGIFISYRREETAGQAGRLYDRLSGRFGAGRVFMDVDSIAIGVDFTTAITEAVSGCDILLALIGCEWLTSTDSGGRQRLDDPDDFVRVEIEAALQRDIRVVPVLVEGAVLPQAADLPPSLQPLIRRQAFKISHAGFGSEVSHLIGAIDAVLAAGPGQAADRGVAKTGPPAGEPQTGLPVEQEEPGEAQAHGAGAGLSAIDDAAYVDGLSALHAGRFEEAVDHFTALQARFPDDPKVQERLQQALLRGDCALWYSRGVAAAERGDWDQAVAAFEQVPATGISDIDAYADTPERLKQARWQQRRHGLIDDVRRLHGAQQWEATIAAGQELTKFDPATPDPDGLITQAHEALAEQALVARYATGMRQFDAQDWAAALDTFTGIEDDRPGYRDTLALLEQVHQLQRKHETKQRVLDLRHRLRDSAESGDWAAVAIGSAQLDALDPDATGHNDLATRARQALLAQMRDLLKARQHQRMADLEHRYAHARAAEDSGQWFEATQHYANILKIDPAYRDAEERRHLCRQRNRIAVLRGELQLQEARMEWPQVLTSIQELTALDPAAAALPTYTELAARARRELATHPSEPQWHINCGSHVNAVAWHPDGKHIAVATGSGEAHIYDLSGKEPRKQLTVEAAKERIVNRGPVTKPSTGKGANRPTWRSRISSVGSGRATNKSIRYINVFDVSFSPDGTRLATAGTPNNICVWDAASGQQLLEIDNMGVNTVAFSPDGTKLATSFVTAAIWDSASGQRLCNIGGIGVNAMAFSPDGTKLATGSNDFSARIWNAANGQQLLKVRHEASVNAVAFSLDGTKLATGSSDKRTRIWDAANGRQLLEIQHGQSVYVVAFSPDSTKLATGTSEYRVRVWDAASGQLLRDISDGRAVAFSPDGTWLAIGSQGKSLRIWPIAGW